MPKTFFTITVDTEADNAWQHPDRIDLQNMRRIPEFQALCEDYGIIPVYLLAYECAVREEALRVLTPIAQQGRCEIGYHLHAWTTPPFENESPAGIDTKWIQAYQHELPDGLFQEKAHCLLDAIEKAYHIRPTAHRAGRWGIDQRTIDWLASHDFIVDTSVVPLRPRSKKNGNLKNNLSFTMSHMEPYIWPHHTAGDGNAAKIVEIPLSVFYPAPVLSRVAARYASSNLPGNPSIMRLYHRMIGGKGHLRPDPAYTDRMVTQIIMSRLQNRSTVLNMMIHSSELLLGGSPFSMTPGSSDRVWDHLRLVFEFVQKAQIVSLPISEIAKTIQGDLKNYESPRFASGLFRSRRRGRLLSEA